MYNGPLPTGARAFSARTARHSVGRVTPTVLGSGMWEGSPSAGITSTPPTAPPTVSAASRHQHWRYRTHRRAPPSAYTRSTTTLTLSMYPSLAEAVVAKVSEVGGSAGGGTNDGGAAAQISPSPLSLLPARGVVNSVSTPPIAAATGATAACAVLPPPPHGLSRHRTSTPQGRVSSSLILSGRFQTRVCRG